MIYDEITHIGRYRGYAKGLDVLIEWLSENDYKALPVGTTQILGDKVYASVQEPTTRTFEEARFETHKKYMDVQVDVEGREAFCIGQGKLSNATEFDEENDIDFCDAELRVDGDLDNDRFVVYLPGEAHMPNVVFPGDDKQQIKKICFKVISDPYFD